MKQIHVLLAVIFLLAFTLLSKYEDRALLRNLDFSVTVKVQDYVAKICSSRCDGTFEDIGFFASPLFSVTAVGLLMIFYRKYGVRILFIPLFFAMLTLVEIYGKTIVKHPAPPFFLLKNPTTIFPTFYVWQEFSYPSGHAARSVFLALVFYLSFSIWHLASRKRVVLVIGLGLYVVLVSLSRIYLGHHWLSDVVGGWLVGGAWGVLTWSMLPTYNKKAMSD